MTEDKSGFQRPGAFGGSRATPGSPKAKCFFPITLLRKPRPSSLVLSVLTLGAFGLVWSLTDAALGVTRAGPRLQETAALVERLGLTDLALFTEARYTRHPTQADRHAPFQDHPFALEHFPTGALILPPRPERGQP